MLTEIASLSADSPPLLGQPKGFVFRRRENWDDAPVKNIFLSTNIQLRSQYYLTPQALALRREHPMQFEMWVAESRGQLLGVVELAVADHFVHIRNLRVGTALQSRGYGSRMLQCIDHFARERGCVELVLFTVVESGSPEFFEKNGFEERERMLSDIFIAPGGEPVCEVKMIKPIDGSQ